jgi:hypothetical protein
MRARALAISVSIAAIAAQSLGLAAPALAANPTTVTFTFNCQEAQFQVPAGVSTVHVVLQGGTPHGGIGAVGGRGAVVSGDLAVTPDETLYLEVGGSAGASGCGAFNGGGVTTESGAAAGGGGTDIRTISRTAPGTLDSRLGVAGGGGGKGAGPGGGSGGDAGVGGTPSDTGGGGGGAATESAGGAGGSPGGGTGSIGQGGNGAFAPANNVGGGGGGGGYYGGGGGGYAPTSSGGGGGGSSYAGGLTNASIGLDDTATSMASITFDTGPTATTPPPDHGTVDATVTMAQSAVCVELSATAIDFGTRQFGDVGIAASPGIGITNCGGVSEDLFAHGSNATGAGPTSWTLDDTGTCAGGTLAADHFGVAIERQDTNAQVRLSGVNKALETLTGGAAIDHLARIDTPCPGSSGAGVVMAMQLTFVATESVP